MQASVKKEIYSWIKVIVFVLVIVFIFRVFIFSPIDVKGDSMKPTFESKDKVLISKMSEIDRFDPIVFEEPIKKEEQYIKRVIGLPGDTVEMKDGVLYINGKSYEEPYLKKIIKTQVILH